MKKSLSIRHYFNAETTRVTLNDKRVNTKKSYVMFLSPSEKLVQFGRGCILMYE